MGTKITARELLFSCAAAPEMIQYYLEIGYLFGVLNRETYWCMFHRSTVPVGAGAVFLFIYQPCTEITYSSCSGRLYSDSSKGFVVPAVMLST